MENIKTIIGFAIKLVNRAVEVTAEDSAGGKKITALEWAGSVPILIDVPGLIKAVPEFVPEFKDLDDTEKAELKAWFTEEFDIPNDKVEGYIELAFNVAIGLSSLFSKANEA